MKKKLIGFLMLSILSLLVTQTLRAQEIVDKMIATVSDGVRTELITRSDLIWQLAMQPEVNLESPSAQNLDETLQRVIEQRLIALEAERLPSVVPTAVEIQAEIRRLVALFPSATIFESRLRSVGFESASDPNFERMIEQRLAIEKYLDFRFRSFTVITPQDEERYYNETFVPQFRRANPGVVIPTLEQARNRINQELTEQKIARDIEQFLIEARERAVVTSLNPI